MLAVGAIGAAVMMKSQAATATSYEQTKAAIFITVDRLGGNCGDGYTQKLLKANPKQGYDIVCVPKLNTNLCGNLKQKNPKIDSKYTLHVTCYTQKASAKYTHSTDLAKQLNCQTSGPLSKGSSGPCVRYLQQVMVNLKIRDKDNSLLSVDGNFGAKTDYVVRKFQKSRAISPNGKVEGKTWAKVDAAAK